MVRTISTCIIIICHIANWSQSQWKLGCKSNGDHVKVPTIASACLDFMIMMLVMKRFRVFRITLSASFEHFPSKYFYLPRSISTNEATKWGKRFLNDIQKYKLGHNIPSTSESSESHSGDLYHVLVILSLQRQNWDHWERLPLVLRSIVLLQTSADNHNQSIHYVDPITPCV